MHLLTFHMHLLTFHMHLLTFSLRKPYKHWWFRALKTVIKSNKTIKVKRDVKNRRLKGIFFQKIRSSFFFKNE